jgi:hypothetical protein
MTLHQMWNDGVALSRALHPACNIASRGDRTMATRAGCLVMGGWGGARVGDRVGGAGWEVVVEAGAGDAGPGDDLGDGSPASRRCAA